MEIKKDTRAVLLSFGTVALTLTIGTYAYYSLPRTVENVAQITTEVPVEEIPVVAKQVEITSSSDEYSEEKIKLLEESDDDTPEVVIPKKTVPVTTVAPNPVVTTPTPVPVVVTPLVVTPPVVVATPTPIKKPSRQSQAS